MPQGIAITFPTNPTEGQSYLAQNGFTYIYSASKNQWKRGGEFVRAPRVLSYAGVAVTTTGSGITTGPLGGLVYRVPGVVLPNSEVGVDSYKAYRAANSYPDYTEVQVSISSAFSSVAYAATFTGTTHTIPPNTLSGNTTYYVRARQFVGSSAASAGVGAISGYSQNIVSFATTSVFLDTPTIVSIAGTTQFPVYNIGFAATTLPATVTYQGSGVGNLEKVEWRVTGPRNPDSTGDVALAEVGIGTFSSATLANALVLAMPFSGATGVGVTSDVNNAIRTASGASAGTTKTVTANGGIGTASVGIATTTSHFYPSAAFFAGPINTQTTSFTYLSIPNTTDFDMAGDFTWECWVYPLQLPASDAWPTNWWQHSVLFGRGTPSLGDGWDLIIGATKLIIQNNDSQLISATHNISAGNWYHIAAVRSNSVISLYVNGSRIGTVISSSSLGSGSNFYIGGETGQGAAFNGYIQDLKIYKGLAKYTENFTPPLPTYGTISYTTRTIGSVGVATTAFFESTGDTPLAEASSTAANALVLAMPMNRTFGFQDINVAIRGLTSGASAGTAKTVGLGTTSTANAPSHPIISSTESKWYDGAAYFDGVNDRISIPANNDFNLTAGGDFTVEVWVYPASISGTIKTILGYWGQISSSTDGWILSLDNGIPSFYWQPHSSAASFITSNSSLALNKWTHISVTKSGSTFRMFVDGILTTTGTNSGSNNASTTFYVGYYGSDSGPSATSYFFGYIQDVKIYKGFAKYTANFTPPQPICGFTTDLAIQTGFTTTSATGVALTSIVGLGSTSTLAFGADQNLIGVTSITSSSGITTLPDPYAQNLVLALPLANITGVGNSFTNDRNTQIRSVSITGAGVTAGTTKTITNTGVTTSSAVTKWYGNTAYFNGSSQLVGPNDSDFSLGTGDFTVEYWVYYTSTPTVAPTVVVGATNGLWIGQLNSNFVLRAYNVADLVSYSGSPPTNRWVHIAVTRQGVTGRIFFDGVLVASNATSQNFVQSSLYIGSDGSGSYSTSYLQDLRIYKGIAKYNTNFTPPPPMFGDYTRSTPNKIVFTPGSDYVLEARNTATGGIVTSVYSAARQWGTKPKGGIYDPYASNLVLAIPGGAVGGATSTFDVTGQIRFETPTATYVNAGIVTYSNSLGIGTYGNKSVTNNNNVSISSTITKYYSRSMQFSASANAHLTLPTSDDLRFGTGDFTVEAWIYRTSTSSEGNAPNGNIIGTNWSGSSQSGQWIFSIDTSTSKVQFLSWGNVNLASTSLINLNQWYHMAVSRKGTIARLFVNGVLEASATDNANYNNSVWGILIGRYNDPFGYNGYLIGHMTDLRVYKGVAKYTSNFTPPNQIYLT